MSNNYFEELEKIANDMVGEEEPMVEDPQPAVPKDEVEKTQAENSETDEVDDQLPASPEESDEVEDAVEEAGEETGVELTEEEAQALVQEVLQAHAQQEQLQEQVASLKKEYEGMSKVAETIDGQLPYMGAMAKIIELSTDDNADDSMKKLAKERFQEAMESDEKYEEILTKTATELFEDEESQNMLYSRDGMEFVTEQLASFVEDDELEKEAASFGGIVGKAKDTIGEYVNATGNMFKMKDEIAARKSELSEADKVLSEKLSNLQKATGSNASPEELLQHQNEVSGALSQQSGAISNLTNAQNTQRKGLILPGAAMASAGGSYYGGKKLYDHMNNGEKEQLSDEMASGTMNASETQNDDQSEGGNYKMANEIVKDFLKVAGAAGLLEVSNNEQMKDDMRKEAADTFNNLSRQNRKDMEEGFINTAQQLYNEDQLHEIVAGSHNDELFEKVAFFTEAADLSADELEKVAGAESVAAKGVGGTLTDAKKNIEEKVDKDKKKTETSNEKEGNKKPGEMRGYNVINNPGEYQVEKSASSEEQAGEMIRYAQMQKEASFKAFVEADEYIKANS